MPPYHFVLCHGWGASPSFWDPLLPFLSFPFTLWNLGYTGSVDYPCPVYTGKLIGVGHSLGFTRLVQSQLPFDFFIGIQSFIKFTPSVEGLLSLFQKNPHHAMRHFWKTSHLPPLQGYDCQKLYEDLKALQTITISLPERYHVLASLNDPILPPSHIKDQFKSISWNADGHHNVVAHDPKWCWEKIQAFI